MPDLFEIQSASGSHPVKVVASRVREAVEACEGTIIIADAFFREELSAVTRPVLFIEANEEAKELAAVAPLIEECRRLGLARNGHIVAVGGGVVQDIACFIATVYMRGVGWTFLPTTLLAMVDSCIGGKSSINVGAFKNLAGSFYPPSAIQVPVQAVQTLPPEHVAAGRCEAAKICFAHGDAWFADYLETSREFDCAATERLVSLSLTAKKWFVETDEFDQNERLLLNFGHSFGHALESCTDYLVTHGIAVGVGCLSAIAFSAEDHPGLYDLPRVAALRADLGHILAPIEDLVAALARINRVDFFHYWQSDKKHSPGEYRPILLNGQGFLYRGALPRHAGSDEKIWAAFESVRTDLAQVHAR